MIGTIVASNFSGCSDSALAAMKSNPQISNLVATASKGAYSGTFDWWLITDADMQSAIKAALDGLDAATLLGTGVGITNAQRAAKITTLLRDNNILR